MVDKSHIRYCGKGFTLAELLVAMVVTGVILTAAATLAYAMSSVNDSCGNSSQIQTQVRYTTLRISELIRQSRLVYSTSANQIVLWYQDKNNNNAASSDELAYIETNAAKSYIRLRLPISGGGEVSSTLINNCSNVSFSTHGIAAPRTRQVSVFFDVVENGAARNYQITAALRGWAGNLLDAGGNIVSDDD